MTIDRQYGDIVFECDTCGETLSTGEGEFQAACARLRHEGWTAYPVDGNVSGDWKHKCPTCRFNPYGERKSRR